MSATAADVAGLHRRILECPGDDALRLVFADALEETGQQERATYIRQSVWLFVNLARFHPGEPVPLCTPKDCEWCATKDAAWRTLHRLGQWWAGDPLNEMGDKVIYTYKRGFIKAVKCTLSQWFGAACQAIGPHHGDCCSGGRIQSPNAQFTQHCRACGGTGGIPAHGPAIVLAHPIEAVTLTDRTPLASTDDRHRWTSRRDRSPTEFWELPDEILKLLPAGPDCTLVRDAEENWASRQSVREYTSRAAAVMELGVALVRWARKSAGLSNG